MAKVAIKNNVIIGDYHKPYIVAEVNSSHNGDIVTAKEMVSAAKECGCDCVKFQSWSPESLYSKTHYDRNPIAKRIVQKFSLSPEELHEMADYCQEVGISFTSTPYSNQEVDFLVEQCNVPYIKVASMEINNPVFLNYIADKRIPVILSTGMAETDEIKKATQIFQEAENSQLVLLHCISIYPAEANTIHLNNILGLREAYPQYPIGFSDHTLGTEIASAAVALGSAVIEKHFTLDNKKMGMDNNMAIEPEQMVQLVRNCHNVYEAMGSKERVVSKAEYEQRKNMRRSIVASKALNKGHKLTTEDLAYKRPGDGLSPDQAKQLIGRVLKHDIQADTLIDDSNLA